MGVSTAGIEGGQEHHRALWVITDNDGSHLGPGPLLEQQVPDLRGSLDSDDLSLTI